MDANAARFNGTLKKWNADRGFGFVAAEHSEQDLFVHVSAFPRDGRLPTVGEPLSFEVALDRDGRKQAVHVRRPGPPERKAPPRQPAVQTRHESRPMSERPRSGSRLSRIGLSLAVVAGCWATYDHFSARPAAPPAEARTVMNPVPTVAPQASPATPFNCDGRTHCSQMTSCAEATQFLRHCPGMEMDGDGDGIPCEQQLCNVGAGG